MANLRILQITVVDSTNITATFTNTLSPDIGPLNITIDPQTPGVPIPEVLDVTVVGNQLQITTQPLTPLAAYFIIFQSVPGISFQSLNGTAFLPNDNVSNRQLITGPVGDDNPIKNYLTSFLQNNVYTLDQTSNVSKYIDSLSTVLAQALYDIRQVKNENYLSYTIVDEQHQRGSGAFDRMNEEAAYEVVRVGKTPTGATQTALTQIPSFPTYPISLLATPNTENLIPASQDGSGIFNVETLTLDLSKQYIIILTSVTFVYGNSSYTYNIDGYGYRILNSEYDPDYASTYLQLANNQIQLSSAILSDPNFSVEGMLYVQVSYQFKDTGRSIDPTTVSIDTVLTSPREVVPPLENVFNLMHAPIVTSADQPGTIGNVVFIDPNSVPGSGTPHPAFINEVPFTLTYIPALPGQYSVDYATGTVYVYGASVNDGTGAYPPLATYSYRNVFSPLIDYTYETDTQDIAYLPNGSLAQAAANISYGYEEVLAQGVDYQVASHVEVLSEFINNNLVALNSIQPQNFPVTDVFRIFNQTTGEIYNVSRWNDTQIYFTYNTPPNIQIENGERAIFQDVLNEVMFVIDTTVVSPSTSIFVVDLNNANIIAASQDCIGSSTNSSATFSNTSIFAQEIYFDNYISVADNQLRLLNVGDYQIDYVNGIVYLLVSNTQSINIGTISYKSSYIVPEFDNVITVQDIYYRFSSLTQKLQTFPYTTFTYNTILPSSFDNSNEEFLNSNTIYPYQVYNNQVGVFEQMADFVPGVSDPVNYVRGLFEYNDLLNNTSPINFAPATTPNGNTITLNPLVFNEYHTVEYNAIDGYYITANTNLLYQSSNITLNLSITRLSDSAMLDGYVITGAPFTIALLSTNSPRVGDAVALQYTYTINNLSRIVVDYDRGGYFIDYTYLLDEIIISYEYGDNALDFRQSTALSPGDTYYITYKVGALRDALLKNFGTLINIPILNNLDLTLDRERYRDALMAAMQSFPTGPSLTSMKNIVQTIVHTPPDIIESAFQNWTLGYALLNQEPIQTSGSFNLVPAKFGNGVVVNTYGQEISFPLVSNLRLEQGTLECWVNPQWDGIDNKSELTFTIIKDGYVVPPQGIFIGPGAYHPSYAVNSSSFSVNTKNLMSVLGKPNESRDGVFIYYAPDQSGTFNRWYVDVMDGYWDGYSDGYVPKNYSISIKTSGKFYDAKSIALQNSAGSLTMYSGTNSLNLLTSGPSVQQRITFVADNQHYIIDAGSETKNRFSIFKDESGYLNFRVIDRKGKINTVSTDVSSWVSGELHQVATSWKIGNKSGRDELHLFIDGFEVPNIIKYNNTITPYLHEKYRTVNPEEIIGMVKKSIVGDNDLTTTNGSNIVSSFINFSAYTIVPGDTIFINEAGFNSTGYTITAVSGQNLTLSETLTITMSGGSFSVNQTSFDVYTNIDLYPNIAVSLLHSSFGANDLSIISGSNIITSASSNFINDKVIPGTIIQINLSDLSPEIAFDNVDGYGLFTIVQVLSATSLMINHHLTNTASDLSFLIYPNTPQEIPGVNALNPYYTIGKDGYCNNVLTIINGASPNDIILIETLGMNNIGVDQKYYVWGSESNVIMTKLPAPIVLCDAEITHWLLPPTQLGLFSQNEPGILTTNMGDGYSIIDGYFICDGYGNDGYAMDGYIIDQPSISDNGRTLSVFVGGENVAYPVIVSINGTVGSNTNFTDTLVFNHNGTMDTDGYQFSHINFVNVKCLPINTSNKSLIAFSIKEKYPITVAENSAIVPVIRYSYQVGVGNTLTGIGGTNQVTDLNGFFSSDNIGNYLVISALLSNNTPNPNTGIYQIIAVDENHQTLTLSSNISTSMPYMGGYGLYQVLDVSDYRSGLQNGFFTFENSSTPGQPYNLVQGTYEFSYPTYLSIPFDATKSRLYVGTDVNGKNIADATIDELVILSEQISDTRIGESVAINQESITKDFNSLIAATPSPNSLMISHFDTFPFINDTDTYITSTNQFIQSSDSVNGNFGKSISLTNTPLIIDNTGILSTQSEGTIEFWINPLYDTGNDPNYRFYFDASAIVSDKTVSINNATVMVGGQIGTVLNVKLQVGDQSVDYFAGGTVAPDGQTIYLNRQLPNQQTPVVVNYIPVGVQGDRISIYKDPSGYINFNVNASGTSYLIRSPAFWPKNSWHRLKATFSMNGGIGSDQIRFFVDGYERGNVLFGNGLLFGQGQVFGSSYQGRGGISASISFKDTINELFIGSDYTGTYTAYALINNLRISNIARPLFKPFGESIDVNYSSNLSSVFPVSTDLYTTLLLNFNTLVQKNTMFSTLKNKYTGQFDFTVDIFDSFGIVSSNAMIKTILETLIDTLKPANSQAVIQYLTS